MKTDLHLPPFAIALMILTVAAVVVGAAISGAISWTVLPALVLFALAYASIWLLSEQFTERVANWYRSRRK